MTFLIIICLLGARDRGADREGCAARRAAGDDGKRPRPARAGQARSVVTLPVTLRFDEPAIGREMLLRRPKEMIGARAADREPGANFVFAGDEAGPGIKGTAGATMPKRVLPPTYFLASLALMAALAFAVPVAPLLAWPWRAAGVVPIAAGVWLNLAADRAFKERGTTVKPFERSSALVTGGAFRLTRNPMYLGMVLILIGVALLLGAPSRRSWSRPASRRSSRRASFRSRSG